MDVQLANYRAKKKREQFIKTSKERVFTLFQRSLTLNNEMENDSKLKVINYF